MPQIRVCPLSQVAPIVRDSGARTMLTLIDHGTPVPRPPEIAADRHICIGVSDITEARDGHVLPAIEHVREVIALAEAWDGTAPLLVHCWAGVSRSTAAAYIIACARSAPGTEQGIADELRDRSPTATPNALMVRLADTLLERDGRMVKAVAAIGRGRDCYEGVPFALDLHARGEAL